VREHSLFPDLHRLARHQLKITLNPSRPWKVISGAGFTALSLILTHAAWRGVNAEDTKPPVAFTEKVEISLQALRQTGEGKKLLQKAQATLGPPHAWIDSGSIEASDLSRTDSTLVRRFDPLTQKESQHREIKVYIDASLPLHEFVLDLAHELTHASSTEPLNPYDPELTAGLYISRSIEARGGEAEALQRECAIARDLTEVFETRTPTRCQRYAAEQSPETQRQKIIRDFYRVGESYTELKSLLPDQPLSAETPVLISSTGGRSYPSSLLEEYHSLTDAACRNSRRRVEQKRSTNADLQLLEKRCARSG
jgi:hypothetical protein